MLLQILVVALATFQVTHWAVVESGPFSVFERARGFAGKHTRAVYCTSCLGFWVGVSLFLLWDVGAARAAVCCLAAVGAHTIIQQASSRLTTFN